MLEGRDGEDTGQAGWSGWLGGQSCLGPIPELGREEEGAMKEVAVRQVQRPKKKKRGGQAGRVGLTWHQLGGTPKVLPLV